MTQTPVHNHSRGIHPATLGLLAGLGVLAGLALLIWGGPAQTPQSHADTRYATPLMPPAKPMRVFHLGHSLVGRDMPAMLQQLAGEAHGYEAQLGWGTPLRAHWDREIEINGFAEENAHDRYRDSTEALTAGTYDAFVATEMVEIRDAIRYHDTPRYLALWADLARQGNPDIRVYLYETWPRTDDPEGWLTRLDRDLERYWQDEILEPAMAQSATGQAIHVIPAGQVFASFVRAVDAIGGLDDIGGKEALFRTDANGAPDPIHLNDLGNYLVALTHYAVLYHKSPVGLPRQLRRADGSLAVAPGAATARLMQETVWQVVIGHPGTGVARTVTQ